MDAWFCAVQWRGRCRKRESGVGAEGKEQWAGVPVGEWPTTVPRAQGDRDLLWSLTGHSTHPLLLRPE